MADTKGQFAQFFLEDSNLKGWVKVDKKAEEVLGIQDGPWPGVPEQQKLVSEYRGMALKALRSGIPAADEASRDKGQGSDEASKAPDSEPAVLITASVSDEEVIRLAEKCELRFNFEDFRELNGVVLDKLNRLSLDRYVVELGAYRRRVAREGYEGEFGATPRIEVMGDNALGRLKVDGLDHSKWHHYWELPENVYARKKMGYVTVDGRFEGVHAGDKSPSGTHHVHKGDGSVELVLMACPKEDANARLQAQADESHGRTASVKSRLETDIAKATGASLQVTSEAKRSEKVRVTKMAE